MTIFRAIEVVLTQLPLILFVGAKFDLIMGFNRMDSGFGLLLFLIVLVPVVNLSWVIIEIIQAAKTSRSEKTSMSWWMPLVAIIFLLESIAIDLYIASHARM